MRVASKGRPRVEPLGPRVITGGPHLEYDGVVALLDGNGGGLRRHYEGQPTISTVVTVNFSIGAIYRRSWRKARVSLNQSFAARGRLPFGFDRSWSFSFICIHTTHTVAA